MGKTPKKSKLKPTLSLATSKDSETRQRETANPNRNKLFGVPKRPQVSVTGKVFKSKLRSPQRLEALKNPTRFQPSTSKDEKKPIASSTPLTEQPPTLPPKMYPETQESGVQPKVSKNSSKDATKNPPENPGTQNESKALENSGTNGNNKLPVDVAEPETPTPRNLTDKETNGDKPTPEEEEQEKITNESTEPIKNDSNLEASSTEIQNSDEDEAVLKLSSDGEISDIHDQNGDSQELNGQSTSKESSQESEKLTINSVDVVESTTSEAPDSGHGTQNEKEDSASAKNQENGEDASFVSYDSSIMLKDVQIKLNDCLKDNSKLFDVSNADESATVDPEKRADMSFGKTLRSISGRSTINRLRYVTLREQRFSPNSSLFVNTSSLSIDPEDSKSCKLTRYATDLSEAVLTNGSPAERKRKIIGDGVQSAKKFKTDGTIERGNLLSNSFEMIKGLGRSARLGSPTGKNDSINAHVSIAEEAVEPKSWCVVM